MVHLVSFLPLIVLSGVNAVAVRDGAEVTKQQRIDNFFEAFQPIQKKLRIPGMSMVLVTPKDSTSVANNGLPYDLFFKSYGVRNVTSQEPIDENGLHSIGSTTKLFTAHVIAMLEEQGLVDWNTPVKNYADVSFFNKTTQDNANLIDLLSHSTGVDDLYDLFAKKGNPLDFIKEAESHPPAAEFRKSYHYSNLMFDLAGAIASNVVALNGSNPFLGWRTLVQEKIFDQLGMKSATVDFDTYMNTSVHYDAFHRWAPSVAGEDKYQVLQQEMIENVFKNHPAAGAIAVTLKDYSNWLMYLLEMSQKGKSSIANIVSKKNHDKIFAPHNKFVKELPPDVGTYGLGVILDDYKGHNIYHHGGSVDTQQTAMCLLPDDGYAMAVFSNTESSPPEKGLCEDIVEQFLNMQDLALAGNNSLAFAEIFDKLFQTTFENNTKLIQKHSSTPVYPLKFPKAAYVGSFNFSGAKVSQ